jgi:hypothetical protein
MANGISKNPYFLTDLKNVNLILVKSAPEKLFCQLKKVPETSVFWAKILGCTFYMGQMYLLKSV